MGGGRKPANDEFEVPDLELKDPLAPKSSAPPPPPSNPGSAYAGTIDDDVLVDHNIVPEVALVSVTRAKAPAVAVPARRPAIELARRDPPSETIEPAPEPRSVSGTIVNVFIVAVGFAGAAAPLLRHAHHAWGWRLPSIVQPALDGASAIWSGAAALLTLALTILLTIMGSYARPRSGGYLFSALGMLVMAISLIIITFSVGPNGVPEVPPDGARLIPLALPAVPLGIGLRQLGNAWRACERRRAGPRLAGLFVAGLAAALIFAAVELTFGIFARV
jgi:hypothetical protein